MKIPELGIKHYKIYTVRLCIDITFNIALIFFVCFVLVLLFYGVNEVSEASDRNITLTMCSGVHEQNAVPSMACHSLPCLKLSCIICICSF